MSQTFFRNGHWLTLEQIKERQDVKIIKVNKKVDTLPVLTKNKKTKKK